MLAPASLIAPGNRVHPLGAFDAHGPAIIPRCPPPIFTPADLDDARLGVGLVAGQLVRRQDRHHAVDARNCLQRRRLQLFLVADDANDGSERAFTQVGSQTQRFHALDNVLNLFVGGVRF